MPPLDRELLDLLGFGRSTLPPPAVPPPPAFARADTTEPPAPWPELAPEALSGLPGRLVEVIAPYTEADPVAVLAHLLVGLGNCIGATPHALVQHERHPCRLFVACVGQSAKSRKGSAWSTPRHCLTVVDEEWATTRIRGGLSSGEGVIHHVRDRREEKQPVRDHGRVLDYQVVEVDAGESDKRLLVVEPELAVVLRRMERESSSLSPLLRQAWDSGEIGTLTKNSPLRATGAHISVIAHITQEEVQRYLTATEQMNGFANRFLWLLVRRARMLPDGAAVPDARLAPLLEEMRRAVSFARTVGVVDRDEVSQGMWAALYPRLSGGEEGLAGAVLARAEAQVLRLSVLYAVLDRSQQVQPAHLRAAVAVWQYAEASARAIFGGRVGVPLADLLLAEFRARGELTRTECWEVVKRHTRAGDLDHALHVLALRGYIERSLRPTPGRSAEVWKLRAGLKEAKDEKEG